MEQLLTINDLDTLCDALDALEKKELTDHAMGGFMSSLMLGMMGDKNDPEVVRFKEEKRIEQERERIELESKQRILKDRMVLIKAKLIQIKDSVCAQTLISAAEK